MKWHLGTNATNYLSTVPQAELYSLGDILATCVNTQGVSGGNPAAVQLAV